MPARPPGDISKGTIQDKLDKLCNDPSKRDALLDDLRKSPEGYVDILVKHMLRTSYELESYEVSYLRTMWFNKVGYWKNHQPIEPIYRQGMIKAIEVATQDEQGKNRAQALPIDSYWICDGNRVQVFVICNDRQVTRINLTPPPDPDRAKVDPSKLTDMAPMWVVKPSRPYVPSFRGAQRDEEVVEDVDEKNRVETVRLRREPR